MMISVESFKIVHILVEIHDVSRILDMPFCIAPPQGMWQSMYVGLFQTTSLKNLKTFLELFSGLGFLACSIWSHTN